MHFSVLSLHTHIKGDRQDVRNYRPISILQVFFQNLRKVHVQQVKIFHK